MNNCQWCAFAIVIHVWRSAAPDVVCDVSFDCHSTANLVVVDVGGVGATLQYGFMRRPVDTSERAIGPIALRAGAGINSLALRGDLGEDPLAANERLKTLWAHG